MKVIYSNKLAYTGILGMLPTSATQEKPGNGINRHNMAPTSCWLVSLQGLVSSFASPRVMLMVLHTKGRLVFFFQCVYGTPILLLLLLLGGGYSFEGGYRCPCPVLLCRCWTQWLNSPGEVLSGPAFLLLLLLLLLQSVARPDAEPQSLAGCTPGPRPGRESSSLAWRTLAEKTQH